jgi:hypothetical protein
VASSQDSSELNKSDLAERVGEVGPGLMSDVDRGVRAVLAL